MCASAPTTRRYFVTYSGVKLPLRLSGELAPDQMGNRNTYFVGEFDAAGQLVLLEKVVYGEVEMSHRYAYDEAGTLHQAEITDADGEVTHLSF